MSGAALYNSAVSVSGLLSASGAVVANGLTARALVSTDTLTVSGAALYNSAVSVSGLLSASGIAVANGVTARLLVSTDTLTVSGAALYNSALSVSGLLSASGIAVANGVTARLLTSTDTLTVSGAAFYNGAVSVSGLLSVSGAAVANVLTARALVSTDTLTVSGNSFYNSALSVSGLLSASGAVLANGLTARSLVATDTLTVSGAAFYNSAVTVSGLLTVSGLNIINGSLDAGFINVTEYLTVSGAATYNSGLTVSGLLTASGAVVRNDLSVLGAARFGSTLSVSGQLSLSGPIIAAGAAAPAWTSAYGSTYVLTASGPTDSVYWNTAPIVSTFGTDKPSYSQNTYIGYGAGSAVSSISTRNTLVGTEAQLLVNPGNSQIVLGTATEAVYIQGGFAQRLVTTPSLNYNMASTFGNYNFPQIVILTAAAATDVIITLPTTTVAVDPLMVGRTVTIRSLNQLTSLQVKGSVKVYSADPNTPPSPSTSLNIADITVIVLVCDGTNWYEIQRVTHAA